MVNVKDLKGTFDPNQLTAMVSDIKFPITKGELIAKAEQSGITGPSLDKIKELRKDTYHNPNEILSGLKKII